MYIFRGFLLSCILATSVFRQDVQMLEAGRVYAERPAHQIVKAAARQFEKKYAKDYISGMSYIKTVSFSDSIVQIAAIRGLWGSFDYSVKDPRYYWDDTSLGRFLPIDSFCTDLNLPDSGNSINTPSRVYASDSDGLDYFDINYANIITLSPLPEKRSIELYSPLNPRQVGNFEYRLTERQETERGTRYVIEFTTRPQSFPKKTKIYGSGRIEINEKGWPERVTVTDVEERYTRFIHRKGGPTVCITPYTLTIEYGEYEGRLFTASVNRTSCWDDSNCKGSNFFYIELPPYRKPFRNRISSQVSIIFEQPLYIDGDPTVKEAFPKSGVGEVNFYAEDSNDDYWKNMLVGGGIIAESEFGKLSAQAKDNNSHYLEDASSISGEEYARRQSTLYSHGRKIYKLIYGKEYHEN